MNTIHEVTNAAEGTRAVVEQARGSRFRLTVWDTDANLPVGTQFFDDKARAVAAADKIKDAP